MVHNDLRKWIQLLETEEVDDFVERVTDIFKHGHQGDSFWIMDDGEPESCGIYTHSNYAYMCFGEGPSYSTLEGEELRKRYGQYFPPSWPTDEIDYESVAMAHGWIRLIVGPKNKRLYINLIKGKAAAHAKQTLVALINTISPYVEEYIVQYSNGTPAGVNSATPDPGRAVGLVNAR